MGFIAFVSTVSFLLPGPHGFSSVATRHTPSCLAESPDSVRNQQQEQALSVFNRTAAKYGLEKAKEIYSQNALKHTEMYGNVYNRTKSKHGVEKAKEIFKENGRRGNKAFKEKYGSIFNATVEKHGLEKALEIFTGNGRTRARAVNMKYGNLFNATVQKYGIQKANNIYREIARKAREARFEKYSMEEIQQMSSDGAVEAARKQGKYTRYPGVRFRNDSLKWRVQFSYKGKIHNAGSTYASEREAAEAHDDYVRMLGLNRPLHFPRKGERTSYVDQPRGIA